MTVLQRIPLPAMITVLKILIANNHASLQQITSAPVYKLAVIEKAVQLQQRFSVSNILYWVQI
ncbi:hypothetical protein T07_400 [Trichinella nelsoni]|uniref:Uncharacterized protein n=1 Tax=Trichinella nelsoni TaxID=6336 RepID=A0A0V0SL72_9BILA|nr:hypothetical protein T07_400 [Trichinella nelsoni]